jgi:hypothetical protein
MIAHNLHLRVVQKTDRDRQPQEFSWLIAVLIVILALGNVSTMVLMLGKWTTMINGIVELERSISDQWAESTH